MNCLYFLTVLMIIQCRLAIATTPLEAASGRVEGSKLIRGLLGRQEFCDPGFELCDNEGCCPTGDECCIQNSCCRAGTYCDLGSNGIIGCCPNGEICTGPSPGNGNPPPPPPSTSTRTFTLTSTSFSTRTSLAQTTSSHPTTSTIVQSTVTEVTTPPVASPSTASSTDTSSFFAPQNTPIPNVGYVNVPIPGNDPRIIWGSTAWTDSGSSCGSTGSCRKTQTGQSSFTYIASSNSSGAAIYIDASFGNTEINALPELIVFINGQTTNFEAIDIITCDYTQITFLPVTSGTINITIVVNGPITTSAGSLSTRQAPSWSFEFNGFMLNQHATSTSGGGSTATGGGSSTGTSIGAAVSGRKPIDFVATVAVSVLALFCSLCL